MGDEETDDLDGGGDGVYGSGSGDGESDEENGVGADDENREGDEDCEDEDDYHLACFPGTEEQTQESSHMEDCSGSGLIVSGSSVDEADDEGSEDEDSSGSEDSEDPEREEEE